MRPTVVDSTQCHLWTDALHTRQLAREALNKWDRGTYVRMTVTTAWVALETSCQDALNTLDIGYRFKENLDRALATAGLSPIDWSQGVWQRVRTLQELRKTYVHRSLALNDMFPDATVANDAVTTVRDAVGDIYNRTNKPKPSWLNFDESRGWEARSNFGAANLTVGRNGAKIEDPDTVTIYMVVDGTEKLTTVLPAKTDPTAEIEQLLKSVRVPISGIRVYESGALLQDLVVNMRGNS